MTQRFARRMILIAAMWAAAGVFGSASLRASEASVTVFAAASLKTALDEIASYYERETGVKIFLSFAGSPALAQQIQHGAPAQIFLSASPEWMDLLENDGLLAPGTRHDLLTNRIVLIMAPGTAHTLSFGPGMDLAGVLGDEKLAMALVNAVPAGIYGRAALQSFGIWDQVAPHVAQAANVRAALRLVATGEAPFGIVYASDAVADPTVHILGEFPAHSHPPIVYPLALLKDGDTAATRAFAVFLTGPVAQAAFLKNGFGMAKEGT